MIYQVTDNDVTKILDTAGGLIGDMMPIVLIILGITIAMYVFKKITQ